jgi:hypothetical protein
MLWQLYFPGNLLCTIPDGLRLSHSVHNGCNYTGSLHRRQTDRIGHEKKAYLNSTQSVRWLDCMLHNQQIRAWFLSTMRLCSSTPHPPVCGSSNCGTHTTTGTPNNVYWFLMQYTPCIMFHVTFYLPIISAQFLQANHFLTTTPMPFSTEVCHLQGILDIVLCHIKLTIIESRFYNNSWVWTLCKNCGPRISKCWCQTDMLHDTVKDFP